MPEVEEMPIVISGKPVAKLIMIYGPAGWNAQVVYNFKSGQSQLMGKGTELLGPDSARQIAKQLAEKWRDDEVRLRRG